MFKPTLLAYPCAITILVAGLYATDTYAQSPSTAKLAAGTENHSEPYVQKIAPTINTDSAGPLDLDAVRKQIMESMANNQPALRQFAVGAPEGASSEAGVDIAPEAPRASDGSSSVIDWDTEINALANADGTSSSSSVSSSTSLSTSSSNCSSGGSGQTISRTTNTINGVTTETIAISKNGTQANLECQDNICLFNGDDCDISLNGNARDIVITGNNNRINIDGAAKIEVLGDRNLVFWRKGAAEPAPEILVTGKHNFVKRRQ